MRSAIPISHSLGLASVTLGVLQVAAGCLYNGDPGSIDADVELESLQGVEVAIIRHSDHCDADVQDGVVVQVGPSVEYAGDIAKSLAPPCEGDQMPPVEIDFDARSITFDFSEVEEPGKFPEGAFDGYIIDFVREEGDPLLFDAAVDEDVSNVALEDWRLMPDLERLEVDLSGVCFDSTSLMRVDFYLAPGTVPAR